MESIWDRMQEYLEAGGSLCLVTIIGSEGSLPQKAGAQMLVGAEGRISGTIGGGAIENEAEKAAKSCLEKGSGMIRSFELTPNGKGDLGMVCGGCAEVLFNIARPEDPVWKDLARMVPELLGEHRGGWVILPKSGGSPVLLDGEKTVIAGPVPAEPVDLQGVPVNTEHSFVLPLTVRDRVVIFGGGHCAFALAPLLTRVGFRVVVYDNRPEYADTRRFPDAERVICGEFDRISDHIGLEPSDYAVVMTSGHVCDLEVENQLLRRELAYVGVMGSKRKVAAVNEKLRGMGIPEEKLSSVHTPIGLPILAVTPEEIAVSVAAELILLRARRSAAEIQKS